MREIVLRECSIVNLSVRAWNVLRLIKVRTIGDFLDVPPCRYRTFRNCGAKTEKELLNCRNMLLEQMQLSTPVSDLAHRSLSMAESTSSEKPKSLPSVLPDDVTFQTLARTHLPVRAWHYLEGQGIRSAKEFLEIKRDDILNVASFGKGTYAAIAELQHKLLDGHVFGDELIDWEVEDSWESLFAHLCDAARITSPDWIMAARFSVGLEPGLTQTETLEQVGQRLGITRERVRQLSVKIRAKISHVLHLCDGMVGRLVGTIKQFLDRPGEGAHTLEALVAFLRENGYPWLVPEQANAIFPLLRLIRLWCATSPLGWMEDTKGQWYAWWDIRTAFGEAWDRLENIVQAVVDGRANMREIRLWRIEQEQTQEWRQILFLLSILGAIPGSGKRKAKSCAESLGSVRPDDVHAAALKSISTQVTKLTTTTHREQAILDELRSSGAMTAQQIGLAIGVEARLVRSSLFALERQRKVQVAGKNRFALPLYLEHSFVREVEAFLREQFARGGVDCGFIYQAYEHFQDRLPPICDDSVFFYAALRNASNFRLVVETYPGVATRKELRTRDGNSYKGPFWEHLRKRLLQECPIEASRMEEIWVAWFGGDPELMQDRLKTAFGFKVYHEGRRRWYDLDETRGLEAPLCFDKDVEVATHAFEKAIGTNTIDLESPTTIRLLEQKTGESFTSTIRDALQERMFKRQDGHWFTLCGVCSEEASKALACQCEALLETFPLVTSGSLGKDLPDCPALQGKKQSIVARNRANFLGRVLWRYAFNKICVRDDYCVVPGTEVRKAEQDMARQVTAVVDEAGGVIPVPQLMEHFPNIDLMWLTKRWPDLCEQSGRTSVVDDGQALTLLGNCDQELRPIVCDFLAEHREEVRLEELLMELPVRCGQGNSEDFLGIYFQGNIALFKRFIALADETYKRAWCRAVLGARNLSTEELAETLPQPFTFDEFCTAGRERCGWTKGSNPAKLWKTCLRLDRDRWITPNAFRVSVKWNTELATQVVAAFHKWLGLDPYFAFVRLTTSQLNALPSLGEEFPWTPELAESVAALLFPEAEPFKITVLDHACAEQTISGVLVPDTVPPETDGIVYLTRIYRARFPLTASVEGALTFIVKEAKVRPFRTQKLRTLVESCFR